ncbi:MAG: lamin tail domain-containing protein [Bacteroidetes bacterium]|nr:lamin tail domain-containing protein [Bacteroidota bacterium]
MLKLQAPAQNGVAFLSSPSGAIHQASWEFLLQMDFNPSSSNYAKIYLIADQKVLTDPLNGYFIKAGGATDDISLYRMQGLGETRIIDGLDGRLNQSAPKVKIRLTRSASAEWKLYVDVGATGNYVMEGTIVDDTITKSYFFGVVCYYTSTRSDKFWFDDILVTGTPVPDTQPPSIAGVMVQDSVHVSIVFSEALIPGTGKFRLNGLETPISFILDDEQTINLTLSSPLANGISYSLQVIDIADLAGNKLELTEVPVRFLRKVKARPKDIIITEIMADPTPPLGLPEAEYIEVLNRSTNPFDLDQWLIKDGSSIGRIPSIVLLPGQYALLVSKSFAEKFSFAGRVIPVDNLPSLNNDGDGIILCDEAGTPVDTVHYDITWYRDSAKSGGGWSLELIDPNNPCGEEDNWEASENSDGGTPGKINSVFANKPDLTGPLLLSSDVVGNTRLELKFSEKIDPKTSSTQFNIKPANDIIRITLDHTQRVLLLDLNSALQRGVPYHLEGEKVSDCSGNASDIKIENFGLTEAPDSADIRISEVLFNPRTNGVDFVEFVNMSEKYFNLTDLRLGSLGEDGSPSHQLKVSTGGQLVPGAYAVLTSSPDVVCNQYSKSVREAMYQTDLPSLADDEGSIVILNNEGRVIDGLYYSHLWHSVFLKDEEGVSLERIDLTLPPRKDNWISASSTEGYATPGYLNSSNRISHDGAFDEVWIEPETLNPLETFAQIHYQFSSGGWIGKVTILDGTGHAILNLVEQEWLGSEGFFRWDGYSMEGQAMRSGYYLVWFQIFNANGDVRIFRRRLIVSR